MIFLKSKPVILFKKEDGKKWSTGYFISRCTYIRLEKEKKIVCISATNFVRRHIYFFKCIQTYQHMYASVYLIIHTYPNTQDKPVNKANIKPN